MSYRKVKCPSCDGTGWHEPIGPCSDGSYITSRPCELCRQTGETYEEDDDESVDNTVQGVSV